MDNPIQENQLFNFNDDWEHIQTRTSSSSDDNLSIVFPPSHHQDLTIVNNTPLPLSTAQYYSDREPASPSSSSISSQPSEPGAKVSIFTIIYRRLGLRLSSKAANLVAKLYPFIRLWKFGILSALFLTLIWFHSRRWRLRRVADEDASVLKKLIMEKNRVIDKLLLEIAQMNEELKGRRSVPVYRIS